MAAEPSRRSTIREPLCAAVTSLSYARCKGCVTSDRTLLRSTFSLVALFKRSARRISRRLNVGGGEEAALARWAKAKRRVNSRRRGLSDADTTAHGRSEDGLT
jgi:hypothetical protein